ncbi:LysE family translocator [Candidatus Peregrinibacteria bacterium]|nr:LysE family translocator [Candidatus Peregrinibacteria bacterium]
MSLEQISIFLAMMLPLVWSAGPNNIMCASVGSKYGIRKIFPFIVGLNLAIFTRSLAIGFGVGALFELYPMALIVLKYMGVFYIFYLALTFLSTEIQKEKQKCSFGFREGFLLSVLNGKGVIVTLLMYSQLLDTHSSRWFQALILSLGLLTLTVTSHFIWVAGGKFFEKIIFKGRFLTAQNYIFSGLLFIVGIRIFLG